MISRTEVNITMEVMKNRFVIDKSKLKNRNDDEVVFNCFIFVMVWTYLCYDWQKEDSNLWPPGHEPGERTAAPFYRAATKIDVTNLLFYPVIDLITDNMILKWYIISVSRAMRLHLAISASIKFLGKTSFLCEPNPKHA